MALAEPIIKLTEHFPPKLLVLIVGGFAKYQWFACPSILFSGQVSCQLEIWRGGTREGKEQISIKIG